jgi:hypothetical protein
MAPESVYETIGRVKPKLPPAVAFASCQLLKAEANTAAKPLKNKAPIRFWLRIAAKSGTGFSSERRD